MEFNSLEEKCRYYQGLTNYKISEKSYVLCHIDGRSFSKKIKNKMNKPFDKDFMHMMDETAKYICKEVQGCKLAYVQSDEISLFLTDITEDETSQGTMFFDGRLCKMQSIIASMATAKFMIEMSKFLCQGKETYQVNGILDAMNTYEFDCKVWTVPNLNDVFAWFLFRNIDCVRNSKNQFSQTYVPHKTLLNKNTDESINICKELTGNDWNDIQDGMKYGRFIRKNSVELFNEKGESYTRSRWSAEEGFEISKNIELFKTKYRMLEQL